MWNNRCYHAKLRWWISCVQWISLKCQYTLKRLTTALSDCCVAWEWLGEWLRMVAVLAEVCTSSLSLLSQLTNATTPHLPCETLLRRLQRFHHLYSLHVNKCLLLAFTCKMSKHSSFCGSAFRQSRLGNVGIHLIAFFLLSKQLKHWYYSPASPVSRKTLLVLSVSLIFTPQPDNQHSVAKHKLSSQDKSHGAAIWQKIGFREIKHPG